MPSDDLVKRLRERAKGIRYTAENYTVGFDNKEHIKGAADLMDEAATRLATPPGDAVEVVAPSWPSPFPHQEHAVPTDPRFTAAADTRPSPTTTHTISAGRAALSSIPEAHGEQMREAFAKAAEAKHVVVHKPRRYEPPEDDDGNIIGTFYAESTTTPMVTWAGVAAWLRSLPLPPAEERT